MDWKIILKNDMTYEQRREVDEEVTKIVNSMEGVSWRIEDFGHTFGNAIFTNDDGYKISGKIPNINSVILRAGLAGPFKKRMVEDMFKPSFRSLDWFLEVITPIDNITHNKFGDSLTVYGTSGNEYNIELLSIKSSGCYEVTTEEGYHICIEIVQSKPVGDNLLGLTLGLLNDEESSSQIDGIQDYISGTAYVECFVCGIETEVEFKDNRYFTCNNCEADNYLENISFEPGFAATTSVQPFDGPLGTIDNLRDYHIAGEIFSDGNAVFTLANPQNFYLSVIGDTNRELNYLGEGIYINDKEFFSEDGYEIDIETFITDDYDIMRLIVANTDYDYDDLYEIMDFENLSGDLWSDNQGEYLDGNGNFTDEINVMFDISNLSEEEFIKAAIKEWNFDESEVLDLFDYEQDGVFWTKDEKKYELDNGEMVEINDEGITKNLSSKAVLPINMKWTDYLKKTSNEEAEDWESALKSFISDGKKLGIPLSVMELLKLAKEATTSQSEGFETLHRPTFSEEEEEDV